MTQIAYKGYLIIETISGDFIVESDGTRICTKGTLEEAKEEIDNLIG
jgi:hypothetical protein